METYIQFKDFVENKDFDEQRRRYLADLEGIEIEHPIRGIIRLLNALPYCFTMQCCYGHFVYDGQNDIHNLEPLPNSDKINTVNYRIAYIALCLDNNNNGRKLAQEFEEMASIDPEYIQFGCAEWFWNQQVNSFVLQVEPVRYADKDRVDLDYIEALKVEKARNRFFGHLEKILDKMNRIIS